MFPLCPQYFQNLHLTTHTMEFRFFLRELNKRKWWLLTLIMSAAVATYFLAGKLPKSYKSSAQLATGIVDYKSIRVGEQNAFVQEYEIQSKFSNLIEYMKSRQSMNNLTSSLMLHDLKDRKASFRQLKSDKIIVSQAKIDKYLAALTQRGDTLGLLPNDLDNLQTATVLEKALGYDYETLSKEIDIKRVGESELIKIEYKCEHPQLAYFVVKNFCDEFLRYFYSREKTTDTKSVDFYQKLVNDKKIALDSLTKATYDYSRNNGVVAIVQESEQIVIQLKDLEMARDEAEKKRVGAEKTLISIGGDKDNFAQYEESGYSDAVATNSDYIRITEQINQLSQQVYAKGTKNQKIQDQIDQLILQRGNISKAVAVNRRPENDRRTSNERELYNKWVTAKAEASGSGEAVKVLNRRIEELKSKKAKLVDNNAELKKITQQTEVVEKEYQYAVERLNQADVKNESARQERPMEIRTPPLPPTEPEKSNRAILSAFAGVASGSLGVVFLFLGAFFNARLGSPMQFRKLVGLPLLGILNQLSNSNLANFNRFFDQNTKRREAEYFKESLRKVRQAMENTNQKVFLFTSLNHQEGKSFVIAALSYALTLKEKKVLIIDTNFKNNTLTGLAAQQDAQTSLVSTNGDTATVANGTKLGFHISLPSVDIIGNRGGFRSPSELLAGVDLRKRLDTFRQQYDFIFMEAAAMNHYSDCRELFDFADYVIPVFDAKHQMGANDEDALQFLREAGDKVLGSVLNKADLRQIY
jgi:polysaccharide biosynthesis transport protein